MNIFKDLSDFYTSQLNIINDEFERTKLLKNPADLGNAREKIVQDYLVKILPLKTSTVYGGYTINIKGEISKQIDLILQQENAINIPIGEKNCQFVENIIACFSVKSVIRKASDIESSILNLASTGYPSKKIAHLSPLLDSKTQDMYFNLPFKILFAYESKLEPNEISEIVERYYIDRPEIDSKSKIDMICISSLPALIANGRNLGLLEGKETQDNKYYPLYRCFPYLLLGTISNKLQERIQIMPHVLVHMEHYLNQIVKATKPKEILNKNE
jgi:hypothetical protein